VILAVALGNPIRGDDGVGLAIGRALEAILPGLELVESMEALPEHAEEVARATRVVFLDASVEGAPGEVRLATISPREPHAALLHALAPQDVLGIARALHGRAPPAALVTVAGLDFSYVERLSPRVAAALDAARDRAAAFLRGE
jgi:hydrogenase maturation protease